MPTDLDPLAVLARTDPAADAPVPEPPSLDELRSLPVPPVAVVRAGRDRSRVVALVAAAALIALVAAATVVAVTRAADDVDRTDAADRTPSTSTPTTTTTEDRPFGVPAPPATGLTVREPAAAALLALAAGAAEELGPPVPDGLVAYTRTVGWRRLVGEEAGRVIPLQWETWTEPGQPFAYRESDGRGALVGDGEIDPGRLPLPPRVELRTDDGVVPEPELTSVEALLPLLGVVPGGRVDRFQVLGSVARLLSAPRSGSERAVLLGALATVDGVEHRGPVTDRAGRPGTAFSVTYTDEEGDTRELVLVLDGAGQALAVENALVGDAPVATDYQVLVTATRVDAVGERPS